MKKQRAAPVALAACSAAGLGGAAQAQSWSDSFDSYANGSGIIGQGGWQPWVPLPLPPEGYVTSTRSVSAPNALRIAQGNGTTTFDTDVARPLTISGGRWVFSIQTYASSAAPLGGNVQVLLMNTYPTPISYSLEVRFEPSSGQVFVDPLAGGAGQPGMLPMITDQWAELRCDVNLDTGVATVSYGGQVLSDHVLWQPFSTPPYTLQGVELGNAGTDLFYFDDVSVRPFGAAACYANCDNSTAVPFLNVGDFVCFQQRFAAGDSYANCDGSTAPPVLNVGDFVCFQQRFAAGCSAP